jgi:hypothetical protein
MSIAQADCPWRVISLAARNKMKVAQFIFRPKSFGALRGSLSDA